MSRHENAVWAMKQSFRRAGITAEPNIVVQDDGQNNVVALIAVAPDGRVFGIGYEKPMGSGVCRSCCVNDPNGAHG